MFPHRQCDTAALEKVHVPTNRKALFLAVEDERLHDGSLDELSFSALCPSDKATFQYLLYLTYCCKGTVFQVTLENPEFCTMSPPVRDDFAYGRLFCFILDMEYESVWDRLDDEPESHAHFVDLGSVDVNLDVFGHADAEDASGQTQWRSSNTHGPTSEGVEETLKEAYNAFMRLQLVRKKITSLNIAMVNMRDSGGELSSMFGWVDIRSDTLNSGKVDKKKVREHQGALFTPCGPMSKHVAVIPESIANLNLADLDESIGKITDCPKSTAVGKGLLEALVSNLTEMQWLQHKVVRHCYNPKAKQDGEFVQKLQAFARKLSSSQGHAHVRTQGLLVFKYSVDRLISAENPDLFVKSQIHRHVPVEQSQINKVLWSLQTSRRTRDIRHMLKRGRCHCRNLGSEPTVRGGCRGDCQMAYECFYNYSECHPFAASRYGHSYYFAQLYPHLGKIERLSKEMKLKHKGQRTFESIADMVFSILIRHKFREDSLFEGLSEVMGEKMLNSSLSLGHALADIHQALCLDPCHYAGQEEPGKLNPLKVYDQALVRYLFCDSLQVGRLHQVSTTFNYIIANSAPRYTIERIMLFNVTGPGEGKSYANNVLNYQFRRVKGCVETLTSFTPQAFKYKQKRTSCVVMIDDAHITHERKGRNVDRESQVIPNTFKNLLDTSRLESEVTGTDPRTGKVMNTKYEAVHNCGWVWNANSLDFVSQAWADRCVIMESEYQNTACRTRSSKQIQDTVDEQKMDRITAVCLYRQNLVQSATMIADAHMMQFSPRFDKARDACIEAVYANYIVCTAIASNRVGLSINQLVFAEAMKLACHFVFDIWIPPWTEIPSETRYPQLARYMAKLNENRLRALDELSFSQICVETMAVYKLCAAACLPDISPRAVDSQGYFACKVIGYILTQIHRQGLKTVVKDGRMCISGIDAMFFPDSEIKGGSEKAHEIIPACYCCKVPTREGSKAYKLCSYRYAANQNPASARRGQAAARKKVGSVTVDLEAVYDLLALHAPGSHSGFWDQLSKAMLEAYESGNYEMENPFEDTGHAERKLTFKLDFSDDPLRSLILEATATFEPLKELQFDRTSLGSETFRCSAPLHYGAVIVKALGRESPAEAYNTAHLKESQHGPRRTFHGPRLTAYSSEYSGVPVKNMSSFCTTRTVYHQDRVLLTVDRNKRSYSVELEQDWEWKDATDVFNSIHGPEVFSVPMLKRDYAATMMGAKGESMSAMCKHSTKLSAIRALCGSYGREALKLRTGSGSQGEDRGSNSQTQDLPAERERCKRTLADHSKQRRNYRAGKKIRTSKSVINHN